MTRNSEERARSILHIGKYYPPQRGGIETVVHDLAVRQARANRVSVIVSNTSSRTEVNNADAVIITRVARFATIASMPVCPGLLPAIRQSPADIVHLHMPNPGAALAFLVSGHPGQLIITHHADTLGRKTLRRLSDPFVARAMQRASRIIVTSRRYLDSSAELLPFRNKCHVIPIGIDVPCLTPGDSASVSELRLRYGNRIILSVGRLVAYKGLDVLLRAMKYIDATLLLVGSGPLASALDSLANDMGITAKVVVLKNVQNLGPLFAAASVFVLPSVTRAESFGVVQLEAMAAGLPVVNTSIDSGVPEVSRHGHTGLTVPPGDEHALARAITLLLDREDLRLGFGAAARNRVLAEFTADRMAEHTMQLYEEIQPSRQRPLRHAA